MTNSTLSIKRLSISVLERTEMLDSTSWSKDFSWKEIEDLAHYMDAYLAPKGVILFHEGSRNAFMCMIVSGRMSVLKRDSDETEKMIADMGPGKTLGEMSLLDGEPHSASVIVTEEATVLLLTKANFENLVIEAPQLSTKLLLKIARLLSQRLRQTSGMLVDYIGA